MSVPNTLHLRNRVQTEELLSNTRPIRILKERADAELLQKSKEDNIFLVIENTMDFFNTIAYLFSLQSEGNEEWYKLNKPGFGFPKAAKFLWKETPTSKPTQISAHNYCLKVLVKVETIFEEKNFPWRESDIIPEDIDKKLKCIWKLMFRILLILCGRKQLCPYLSQFVILDGHGTY
eukprot:snap_masked-scaffold_1-processed-gene-11.20-mRNA-1 protein AED:1.00 eAED:1.00 QI:0/0/0/0/1/1/2/0/176